MGQQKDSRMETWAARLAGLPRGVRMLLAGVIALLLAGLASQLMGLLFGPAAMTDMGTATTLLLVAAVAGFVTYGVGWWALLGFSREPVPPSGRRAVYFTLFGVLVLVALAIWLLISFVIASLPPEVPI